MPISGGIHAEDLSQTWGNKNISKINIPGFREAVNEANFTRCLNPWLALIEMTFKPAC